MDCEEAANLLCARVDGESDANADFALDAHLAECESCRALSETLAVQDAALLRAFAPHRAVADAIADRVSSQFQKAPRATGWKKWIAAAAILLVGIVLSSRWMQRREVRISRPPSSVASVAQLTLATGDVFTCPSNSHDWQPLAPGDSVAAGARVRTADAAKCEMVLTDGSRIRLNTQTEACFTEPRNVQVARGQLWSAVADSAVPLKISTDHASVTAKGEQGGTRVDLAWDAEASTVTVLAGAADVAADGRPTTVIGGQSVRVPLQQPDLFRCASILDTHQPTRWQDDLLTLKPGNDPELVARVKQLLARVSAERSAMNLPGPVEQDIRSRGQAWSAPIACVARSPGVTPEERRTAARLLADLAPAWCLPDLIELLNDEDGQVRSNAAKALHRLTGQSIGMNSTELAKTPDPATVAAWREWWTKSR